MHSERARWIARAGRVGVSVLLLVGCAQVLGIESGKLQGSCTSDAQCAPSFGCLLGSCRSGCTTDADCGSGSRCLRAIGTSACVPVSESCDSGCPDGTVCTANVCRTTCKVTGECLSDQACTAGICIGTDPSHETSGDSGEAGAPSGNGGSSSGGASPAGGNAGNMSTAGSDAAGSPTGGGDTGGTSAAGTNAGGSNAGGTSSGGTSAGGSNAGGTSGGGQGGATASCGDGVVEAGEQCDDKNMDNSDACVSGCKNATCGDGFLWQGKEACDYNIPATENVCARSCEFSTWALWPVPDPLGAHPPSYDTSVAGIVTDNVTKLIWQRAVDLGNYTWATAQAYCDNLSLAGFTDWRLPTRIELVTLTNSGFAPSIDTSAFPGTPSAEFWTSSSAQFPPGDAFTVEFTSANTATENPTSTYRVRCVR